MIKIEVTGASIPEVADKLIAIGRSLYNTSVNDADNAAREALQAQRDAVKMEVAEPAPSPEPVSEATEAPSAPATLPESGTPTSDTGPTAETASPTELNFELDVAPIVLRTVAVKGKPFVQDVLSEFGAARASDLDDSLWPELVSRLKAELA